MNDFEIKQLIYQLQNKYDQKIAELEREIAELKNQLVKEPVKENHESGNALLSYYLNKYENEASEIKRQRLEGIVKEISDLNDDLENLQNQLENTKQRTEQYQTNLELSGNLQYEREKAYLKIEDCNFNYERKCNDLYKDAELLDDIYNDKVNRYINIVGSFLDGDLTLNELNEKISNLVYYFYDDGYKKASVLIDLVNNIEKLTKENKKNINDATTLIQNINEQLSNLDLEDPSVMLEELKHMVEDLEQEKVRKNQVHASLTELVDSLINKHLSQIKDQMNYLSLIDADKHEISSKLEALITELIQNLKTSDTDANRKNNLLLRLGELEDQIATLEEEVVRKTVLENEYKEYEEALSIVTQNQLAMQNYIEKAYSIIKSNNQYRNYFDNYVSSNTKIKELTKTIETTRETNDELRDQRKSLVLDPYAKAKLDEIDEKIAVNERNINHSLQEIHFLREDLKARGTANERLYKVIKDKEVAESKLPEIESKKDLLIQELTRRYEELQSYNEKIDEYNRLVKEAEEINERIQNNNY